MATTNKKGRDSGKSATPTTSANDTALALHAVKGEWRIDSRVLAQLMDNQHESVLKLLTAFDDDFRQLGVFRFQIGKPPAGSSGGRPEKYAFLNEDQTYLLLTYSRNTTRYGRSRCAWSRRSAKRAMPTNWPWNTCPPTALCMTRSTRWPSIRPTRSSCT